MGDVHRVWGAAQEERAHYRGWTRSSAPHKLSVHRQPAAGCHLRDTSIQFADGGSWYALIAGKSKRTSAWRQAMRDAVRFLPPGYSAGGARAQRNSQAWRRRSESSALVSGLIGRAPAARTPAASATRCGCRTLGRPCTTPRTRVGLHIAQPLGALPACDENEPAGARLRAFWHVLRGACRTRRSTRTTA
jgi:hypothetical protein